MERTFCGLTIGIMLAATTPAWAQTPNTTPAPTPAAPSAIDAARAAAGAAAGNIAGRPPTAVESVTTNGGSLVRAMADQPAPPGTPAGSQQVGRAVQTSLTAVPRPDPKRIRKHDLLTIIVREESKVKSDGKTDTSKTSNISAEITDFINLQKLIMEASLQGGGVAAPKPIIGATGTRTFGGTAAVERNDVMTTRIAAEVVDVKPNGTIILQARKTLKNDDEVQRMVLSGTARALDVSIDNTILSTQLYDLVLEKTHTGAVRDGTVKGFVPKLIDKLNPF